jgi:general stress protein 26
MRLTIVALLALLLSPPGVAAQDQESSAPGLVDVARQVMADARYCTLVTIGPDGRAESRIVDPFPPEPDMTVWLATNRATRKVAQIRENSHVTLFYWDRETLSYVTLLGDAVLVDDPAEKEKRWKEEWSAFYPQKNHGPEYLLIRVTPKRLEALAPDLPPDPKTWQPQHVEFP